MLPFIIAGSAIGGAVTLKLVEYGFSYVRSKRLSRSSVQSRKNAKRKKPAPKVEAEAKPKNTRRLVEQANEATKKATVSDAKPVEKIAQGKPSLREQLEKMTGSST